MTCSMAMCGFVNMSIVKTGAGLVSQREEAHFLQRCCAFARGCARYPKTQTLTRHRQLTFFAWEGLCPTAQPRLKTCFYFLG